MNLLSTLSKLLGPKAPPGGRALDTFEKSFQLRQSKGYLVNLDDPFKYLRRLPRPEELIPTGGEPGANGLGSFHSVKPVPATTVLDEGRRNTVKTLVNVSTDSVTTATSSNGDSISPRDKTVSTGFNADKTSAGSGSDKTLSVASHGDNTLLNDFVDSNTSSAGSNANNASFTVSNANTSSVSNTSKSPTLFNANNASSVDSNDDGALSAASNGNMFARNTGNNVAGSTEGGSTSSTSNGLSGADLPKDDSLHRALFKEAETKIRSLQTVKPIVLQGPRLSTQIPDGSNAFSTAPNNFLQQQAADGTRSRPPFFGDSSTNPLFARNQQSSIPPFGNQRSNIPPFGNQQTGMRPFGNQQSGTPFFGNQPSDVARFGNQQSGTPFFGNQPPGVPPFGNQQSGAPFFGNRQSSFPPIGNQQPGVPPIGSLQSGMQPLRNQQSDIGIPSFGNQQSGTPFGDQQSFANFGFASSGLSNSSPGAGRFQTGASFGPAEVNGSLPVGAIPRFTPFANRPLHINNQSQNFPFGVSSPVPGRGTHFGDNNVNQDRFIPFGSSNSIQDRNAPFGFSNPISDGNSPFERSNTLENQNTNRFSSHPFGNSPFGRSASSQFSSGNPVRNAVFSGGAPLDVPLGPSSLAAGSRNGLPRSPIASASLGLSSRPFLGGSTDNSVPSRGSLFANTGPFRTVGAPFTAAFSGSNRMGNRFDPSSPFSSTSPFGSNGRRASFGNLVSQSRFSGTNAGVDRFRSSFNPFNRANNQNSFFTNGFVRFNGGLGVGSNFMNPFLSRSSLPPSFSPMLTLRRPSFGGGGFSFRPGSRFSTTRRGN